MGSAAATRQAESNNSGLRGRAAGIYTDSLPGWNDALFAETCCGSGLSLGSPAPQMASASVVHQMKPRMFLGSSVEGKRIADAVALSLDHVVDCVPWPTAFPLSDNTIDSLLATFPDVDFGAFVLSPDDKTTMRERGFEVARDNVLFEAGLFMGSHGKSRTFLITPRDSKNFHIPTDLLGLTPATYDVAREEPPSG
jgi:predicted nucleotide-binding protein